MTGLLLVLYLAILSNFPGYLIQIIGFVLIVWAVKVVISGIKQLLNPDFMAFEDEMDDLGLTRSGKVQVSRHPSGISDIEKDDLFMISFDGTNWATFTPTAGAYYFRGTVISRKSLTHRTDTRLAYYKKANAYFIYEEN
jgi:hypothetical protein